MKHTVLSGGLDALAIRPPESFAHLTQQSAIDVVTYLSDPADLHPVPCPGCLSEHSMLAHTSNGFSYRRCSRCESLYVSPRPSLAALERYYSDSEAGEARTQYFTEASEDARVHQILRSRVEWIYHVLSRGGVEGGTFCDIGTLYPRLFDELRDHPLFDRFVSIGTAVTLQDTLRASGIEWGAVEVGDASVVTAFEQLEHHGDPRRLLSSASAMLRPNGILFLTTRTSSGFDLQVLGESAPYIFVPEHLNLLSLEALEQMVEDTGFELIELSTPGQLDVDFVQRALAEDPSIEVPRFVRYLIEHRDADAHTDFQAFLQRNRLSSHVRVTARKKP